MWGRPNKPALLVAVAAAAFGASGPAYAVAECYPSLGYCAESDSAPAPGGAAPSSPPAAEPVVAPAAEPEPSLEPQEPDGESLLAYIADGRWAVGNAGNCRTPKKIYTLAVQDGAITWRSGVGNVDVETISFDSEVEATTETISSVHVDGRGVRKGTAWSYSKTGPDSIRVSQGGKSQFMLVRCR